MTDNDVLDVENIKFPNADDEVIEKFANAIILQAVYDYRRALKGYGYSGKPYMAVIYECENFFRSEWFRELTTLDGEMLIEKLRKEVPKWRK